jgi:hypothetical protein
MRCCAALVWATAAALAAAEHGHIVDGQGVRWLFNPLGDLIAIEQPAPDGTALFLDPSGRLMGWRRYDASLGGEVYVDYTGAIVGFERPDYALGVDLFAADGRYRGMSLSNGDDVDASGALVPGGLFPVWLYWTQEAGSSGVARW